MKKLIAAVLTLTMLFAFASCKDGVDKPQNTPEVVTDSHGEAITDNAGEVVTKPANTEATVNAEETTATGIETTAPETTLAPITLPASDPSEWTDEEIVEFYKAAAIRSKTKVKSTEYKNLEEMVVNDGDGILGTFVEWATPFLVGALEDSQVVFDGVTGGYEKLVVSDAKTVKAYKNGEYTVVEMTMKEQTDGLHGDRYGGTVGHAISVVGDISSVEDALAKWFRIDFENCKISLRYTEPTIKVKINKDGIIEKGTWSYTIKVDVSNLKIAAVRLPIEVMIESAYGTVGYIITTGGGF